MRRFWSCLPDGQDWLYVSKVVLTFAWPKARWTRDDEGLADTRHRPLLRAACECFPIVWMALAQRVAYGPAEEHGARLS